MDGTTVIAQLRDIRMNLADSVRSAMSLENKFTGPRPSEGKTPSQAGQESIGTLLSDIGVLSAQLSKMLCHQHDILGDFNPPACEPINSQAGYSRLS